MTFINARLPQEVEINAVRREREAVEIVRTDGGHEVRNARHSQGTFEYEVGFPTGGYDSEITNEVYAMWRASRGGLYAFRFRDWDTKNNTLTDEIIGTGDGTTTLFPITQTHTVGGVSSVRRITRPVSPFVVKRDGVVAGSGYSINYDTGVLTFSSAPSLDVVVSVSGVFDIPVRFDLAYEATGLASFLEHIDGLALIEVKE
jgi:uncharacterized protein (TIGR02217 family)